MKNYQQLTIDDVLVSLNQNKLEKQEPYRNGLGQLLPWEEPDYLKKLEIIGGKNA